MMLKPLRRIMSQPFIAATGFAALIHSTWSLGTFFSGFQPSEPVLYAFWLIPAFLMAFSLDVGQLATSAEIRDGQRSRMKYITFASFAIATYFLQFVFIAAHMPTIPLSAGVRAEWIPLISLVRDAAVFVIPALLPLSTTLYTFSQDKPTRATATITQTKTTVKIEQPDIAPVANKGAISAAKLPAIEAGKYPIACDDCDWSGTYTTSRSASNALVAHRKSKHPAYEFSSNGHKE